MSRSERNRLAGGPSNVLVRRVRSRLAWYGIRPTYHNGELWELTWEWANNVANSYLTQRHWPLANEIAAQYVFLLVHAMRERRDLKLPYRAAEHLPEALLRALSSPGCRSRTELFVLPAPTANDDVA